MDLDLDLDTVLTLLECPVCLLPPRAPPIFQCTTGHLVCSECQPSLIRCPICDIKYRSCLTRDFFAEKLLEHLERNVVINTSAVFNHPKIARDLLNTKVFVILSLNCLLSGIEENNPILKKKMMRRKMKVMMMRLKRKKK